MSNLSNYTQTIAAYGSTSAFPGSTGSAIALTTTNGFPFGASTAGGFDMSGWDGAICIATVTNTTAAAIQALISGTTNTLTTMTTSSGWSVAISTGNVGYSTAIMSLQFDLYRPVAKFVAFQIGVPTTSGYPLAASIQFYADRRYPTSLTNTALSSALVSASTVFVSPSTN